MKHSNPARTHKLLSIIMTASNLHKQREEGLPRPGQSFQTHSCKQTNGRSYPREETHQTDQQEISLKMQQRSLGTATRTLQLETTNPIITRTIPSSHVPDSAETAKITKTKEQHYSQAMLQIPEGNKITLVGTMDSRVVFFSFFLSFFGTDS